MDFWGTLGPMGATEVIKTRITPETKARVAEVTQAQLLTESIWLRRLVLRELRAAASEDGPRHHVGAPVGGWLASTTSFGVLPHRELLPDCLVRYVTESLPSPISNQSHLGPRAGGEAVAQSPRPRGPGRSVFRTRGLRLCDSFGELVGSHGAISPVACRWLLVWLASAVDRSQISECERASRPATTAPL